MKSEKPQIKQFLKSMMRDDLLNAEKSLHSIIEAKLEQRSKKLMAQDSKSK